MSSQHIKSGIERHCLDERIKDYDRELQRDGKPAIGLGM